MEKSFDDIKQKIVILSVKKDMLGKDVLYDVKELIRECKTQKEKEFVIELCKGLGLPYI